MLGKLAGLGLVIHDRYHETLLGVASAAIALEMVRRHCFEMYLTKALEYGWDEVHEEADRIEHHISKRLEERCSTLWASPPSTPTATQSLR